jgi:putative nucleotidyltransferase with HDIG domain
LHPGELWRHGVTCAQISQLVLRKVGWAEDSYAYTAALLHDVGKLILDQFVDSSFDQICRLMATGSTPVQAEKKVLGIDHSEVGGLLGKSWKFPDLLTEAIRSHHRSLDADGPRLFQVVELSNLIAHVSTYQRAGLDLRIGPDVLRRFGLDQQGIQDVIEGVTVELQRAEDLFKIPLLKN